MHKCPKCHSAALHRSRSKSKWEAWRKHVTGKRPYRCSECKWRGWGPNELVSSMDAFSRAAAERALAPDPPNLMASGLGPSAKRPAIDFDRLDAFDQPAGSAKQS